MTVLGEERTIGTRACSLHFACEVPMGISEVYYVFYCAPGPGNLVIIGQLILRDVFGTVRQPSMAFI